MPNIGNKPLKDTYGNSLNVNQSSNTGADATTREIQDGFGNNTSASISDDVLSVKPQNDDTTGAFLVKNKGGNNILAVDTTDSLVKVGASQINATTQYAYFGANWTDQGGFTADLHHAVPFNTGASTGVAGTAMGSSTSSSFNDTNPATSLTLTTNAHFFTACYWHVIDNITIDAVSWWHGADTATGDSTAAHLMGYDVVSDNSSNSGNLSNGTVLADAPNITNAGYEQIYYQQMTIPSADVNAGKVILFAFRPDTINSDYSISATIKYHLR